MGKKISDRFQWLFGSHYKMERFGVMFSVLCLCMALLMGSIVSRKIKMDRVTLGNEVIYTTTGTMSLSGNTCNLVNIWRDDLGTKCFVLLQFTDPSRIVTDAKQYQVFLTGSNLNSGKEVLQSNPQGIIYMFGNTGYMGIYLVDAAGFPAQIVNMIIRCNSLAVTPMENLPEYPDASSYQYDQMRVYFNPGGSAYNPGAFLNEARMDIYDIYEGTIAAGSEAAIRESLDADLRDMQAALVSASEYERRLSQEHGISIPEKPVQIRGDEIIVSGDGALSLKTSYVLSGGYDFDWRGGSIQSGYLSSVIPDGYDMASYLSNQRTRAATNTFSTAGLRWYHSDGTLFDSSNPLGLSSIASINNDIDGLTKAWSDFYAAKLRYQTVDMAALLSTELGVRDAIGNYTQNTENVVSIW